MTMMLQRNAALLVGRGAIVGRRINRTTNVAVVRATSTMSLTNFAASQNAAALTTMSTTTTNGSTLQSSRAWKSQTTTTTVRGFQSMYAPAALETISSSSQQQQQQQWAVGAMAAAAITAGVLLNADNDRHRAFCCGIVGVVGKKDHGDARYDYLFFLLTYNAVCRLSSLDMLYTMCIDISYLTSVYSSLLLRFFSLSHMKTLSPTETFSWKDSPF
jgi:hypothetical protein